MTVLRRLSIALCLGAAAVPLLEIGCSDPKALPKVTTGTYAGPAMVLDSSGETYVIIVNSPAPGWVPTLDRVADQYKFKAIFITLRKPNPSFYYPEGDVQQRVGSAVLSSEAVEVYARILAFDQPAEDEPYTLTIPRHAPAHNPSK
jgi:hypothetical protein